MIVCGAQHYIYQSYKNYYFFLTIFFHVLSSKLTGVTYPDKKTLKRKLKITDV